MTIFELKFSYKRQEWKPPVKKGKIRRKTHHMSKAKEHGWRHATASAVPSWDASRR
jgi:hypothetical protein